MENVYTHHTRHQHKQSHLSFIFQNLSWLHEIISPFGPINGHLSIEYDNYDVLFTTSIWIFFG